MREATLGCVEVQYQDLVPMLRLRGRWLERFGFRMGTRIYVEVEAGKLVITTNDPAESRSATAR